MMEKQWKNFGDYYIVSEFGDVVNVKLDHVMTHAITKDGYEKVDLIVDGKRKKLSVHRVVGMLYVEGFSEGLEINHIDGDKTNNHFSNLEWVEHCVNVKHAWSTGLRCKSTATFGGKRKETPFGAENHRAHKVMCLPHGEIFDTMTEATTWAGLGRSVISRFISDVKKGKDRRKCGNHPVTGEPITWVSI